MDFGLDESQRLFDESLRGFLGERLDLDGMRRIAETDTGFDAGLWQDLVGLGLPGLMVPEEYGGTGLATLDAAVAAEALGHVAAPTPFISAAVMAPLALRLLGDAGQQAEWLPRIAAGDVRISTAFCGLAGTNQKAELRFGNAISGRVEGALEAGGATHFLLIGGDGAALVAADAPGVTAEVERTIDRTRPMATVTLRDAEGEIFSGDREAALRVLDAGRVMLAADTYGACRSMFDKALAYSRERVQFDRKIGSFQAVKHQFADMITRLEPCRALVWYAAHAQETVPEERRAVACHAKAHLSEIGRDVARQSIELHGGMGFTDLMGLHFWYKRVTANRLHLGSPERCRREAAFAEGWAEAV